jgi:hypothetical protein
MALAAYHRIIGLLLADIGADGCITKAPAAGTRRDRHRWTDARAAEAVAGH